MELNDKKDFGVALSNTLEVYRVPVTPSLISTWFEALLSDPVEKMTYARECKATAARWHKFVSNPAGSIEVLNSARRAMIDAAATVQAH